MRIAIAGTHGTGKTSLVDELSRHLPGYERVEEPYRQLEEEGHVFLAVPALEDFEAQLERSIDNLLTSGENTLFDRCPADLVAYLLTHDDAAGFDFERWLPQIRPALARLDLLVLVTLEDSGRLGGENDRWRTDVDERLQDIVEGGLWETGVAVLEVAGSTSARARQVLAHITSPRTSGASRWGAR
jgi:thymidylate kinase